MKKRIGLIISCSLIMIAHADDLEHYIKRVKARPAGKIESFPRIQIPKPHAYQETGGRDPFTRQYNPTEGKYRPDLKRPKEALEGFALDTLRMVGTFTRREFKTGKSQQWALISTTQKSIYAVTIGSHMGRHYGEVKKITPREVKLIERYKTHSGWEERPASLVLAND